MPWLGLSTLLVLTLLLAAFVAYFFFGVGKDGDDNSTSPVISAEVGATGTNAQVSGHQGGVLGFPAAATRNTTRISSNDAVDVSVAAAFASYPTKGPGEPPGAVTIVDSVDWQSGVAAASLSAAPIGSPIILAPSGTLSAVGEDALTQLNPLGTPDTGENTVFTVGSVAPPSNQKVKRLSGSSPAEIAVAVATERVKITGNKPAAIVVVSSEAPDYATPAATWAARSGDVVLFTEKESVPKATLDFIKKKDNKEVPIFVLGPTEAVSSKALNQLDKAGGNVERVGGDNPETASVELARYSSGLFGWNLNDPGHGYTLVRTDQPMSAIAATSLSTGGTWPALLLTDSAEKLPKVVEDYLLDNQPGYVSDPTRAVTSHGWVIGDESAISVNAQARFDNALELEIVETAPEP